jgi:hypothetical protein
MAPVGVCLTLSQRRSAEAAAARAGRKLSKWCADVIATAARQSELRIGIKGSTDQDLTE